MGCVHKHGVTAGTGLSRRACMQTHASTGTIWPGLGMCNRLGGIWEERLAAQASGRGPAHIPSRAARHAHLLPLAVIAELCAWVPSRPRSAC